MDQLTGKADIYVDGTYFDTSQEGATLDGMAGVENTAVVNSRGVVAGYTSKGVPAVIKANFLHGPDFDITLFSQAGQVSVAFVCDNGVEYQMSAAVFSKADTFDSTKGMVALSFTGTLDTDMSGNLPSGL